MKQVFRKKQYFWRKRRNTHLWEEMTHFEGRGHLATKINITFFVGIDVLNIFYLTTFSKKNNIFQNISEKLFLGVVTVFEGRVVG